MPFQSSPADAKTELPLRASDESVSIFLDIVRFTAAFFVFVGHFSWTIFSDMPSISGHGGVIIFFVLSGYVIALTTENKDATLRQYATARLARLYSVVIPALILTYVVDSIGLQLKPELYHLEPHDYAIGRLLAAATYTSQLWFLSINPLSDMAYWSLPYEFWFYVMWGLYFYLDGRRRNLLLMATAFFVGPKILMYLPIWLLGVVIYRGRAKTFGKVEAYSGIIIGLTLLPVLYSLGVLTRYDIARLPDGTASWRDMIYLPDGFSLCDYGVAVVVAAIIFLFPSTGIDLKPLKKPVHFFASRTFSLYLYHLPLLHFFTAIAPSGLGLHQHEAFVAVLTITGSLTLATYTELKKGVLARFFNRLLPDKLAMFGRRIHSASL